MLFIRSRCLMITTNRAICENISIKFNFNRLLPFTFKIALFSSILRQSLNTEYNQFTITSLSILIQQFIAEQIAGVSRFVSGSRVPSIAVSVNGSFTIWQSTMPDMFLGPKIIYSIYIIYNNNNNNKTIY